MVLRFAVIGKSGHRAKIIVLAFLAVAIMVALDYIRGFNGWSINYVFPSAVIAVDVGILLLIFINKRNWQSYVMPELFDSGKSGWNPFESIGYYYTSFGYHYRTGFLRAFVLRNNHHRRTACQNGTKEKISY